MAWGQRAQRRQELEEQRRRFQPPSSPSPSPEPDIPRGHHYVHVILGGPPEPVDAVVNAMRRMKGDFMTCTPWKSGLGEVELFFTLYGPNKELADVVCGAVQQELEKVLQEHTKVRLEGGPEVRRRPL